MTTVWLEPRLSNYRAFSLAWPVAMQMFWGKREFLHKKKVHLPRDWFGTPTWSPFQCFRTPKWWTESYVWWKRSILDDQIALQFIITAISYWYIFFWKKPNEFQPRYYWEDRKNRLNSFTSRYLAIRTLKSRKIIKPWNFFVFLLKYSLSDLLVEKNYNWKYFVNFSSVLV